MSTCCSSGVEEASRQEEISRSSHSRVLCEYETTASSTTQQLRCCCTSQPLSLAAHRRARHTFYYKSLQTSIKIIIIKRIHFPPPPKDGMRATGWGSLHNPQSVYPRRLELRQALSSCVLRSVHLNPETAGRITGARKEIPQVGSVSLRYRSTFLGLKAQ